MMKKGAECGSYASGYGIRVVDILGVGIFSGYENMEKQLG